MYPVFIFKTYILQLYVVTNRRTSAYSWAVELASYVIMRTLGGAWPAELNRFWVLMNRAWEVILILTKMLFLLFCSFIYSVNTYWMLAVSQALFLGTNTWYSRCFPSWNLESIGETKNTQANKWVKIISGWGRQRNEVLCWSIWVSSFGLIRGWCEGGSYMLTLGREIQRQRAARAKVGEGERTL